jgi:hypothetical protein
MGRITNSKLNKMQTRRSARLGDQSLRSRQNVPPPSTSVALESTTESKVPGDVQNQQSALKDKQDSPQNHTSRVSLRKPWNEKKPGFSGNVDLYMSKQVTDEERQNWRGWCEVESEPVSRTSVPNHETTLH